MRLPVPIHVHPTVSVDPDQASVEIRNVGCGSKREDAAVTLFEPDGAKTAIAQLTDPRLDGDKLSYNVKVLQGIGGGQPAAGVVFII
jgi:hypothetical protein